MDTFGLALQSLLGVVLIPLTVWLFSASRSELPGRQTLRIVGSGLALQYVLVALFLLMPWTTSLFAILGDGVAALQAATDTGARLVFGFLAGGPAPFDVTSPNANFVLAFRILPLILVLSALVRLLYYWGILQRVVQAFAWALQRTFATGGPLATAAAGAIFLGLIEAPLLVRPYLREMSRGALFAVMSVVMATVAGSVMALYAGLLAPVVAGAAGHLITGSVINVPGALMLARLSLPDGFSEGPANAEVDPENLPTSSMDAIVRGTSDGVQIVAAVAATLIVMVALVALANQVLGLAGPVGGEAITVQRLLGYACIPFAFVIGIPWSETVTAGALIGQKVVLNEFLAYLELLKTPQDVLSERSRLLLTYALCGFANLGSLGILIGGLSVLIPERRAEIAQLAPRAMLIGFLTTLLTAAIIGTTVWS